MSNLSATAQLIQEVREDFEVYASTCLQILDKDGSIVHLELNDAQRYIHKRLEQQLAETGRVRAIILKGRQQGASTYIEARFYWKLTGSVGKKAFILTHLEEATENLFSMTKRYNDNCPQGFRPHTRIDNAKELHFDVIDCKYAVATAGSQGTGRGATAQLFHGSEVAFWRGAEKHMAGIGQTIPDAEDTEIILESTANGVGNVYHRKWQDALDGRGEYIAIFVPWFWQREYRKKCPEGVVWSDYEHEYRTTFNLDDEQMWWRRCKIIDDFNDDETLFDQEYPATPEMAFMAGSKHSFISPLTVARARKVKKDPAFGAVIIGVDPAEYGDDDTAICIRKGFKVLRLLRVSKMNGEQVAGVVGKLIEEYQPDAVFVDVGGVGTAVEQFLTAANHKNVYRVNFGGEAIEKDRFVNKACEMWWNMGDWLKDERCQLPAKDDRLQSDLVGRQYDYDYRRRFRLETKEHMRSPARGLKSPDSADALALTFAMPIAPREEEHRETLIEKIARVRGVRTDSGDDGGMAA